MGYITHCPNCQNALVSDKKEKMQTVSDIADELKEYRNKKKEYLIAVMLNARHEIMGKEVISIGTLTASLAHPREIFAPLVEKGVAAFILAHNHPSGDPQPSEEDIRLTKRIQQCGNLMGIELVDHLILAKNGCYSFKASGGL